MKGPDLCTTLSLGWNKSHQYLSTYTKVNALLPIDWAIET